MDYREQAKTIAEEFLQKAKLSPGQTVVVGCSTSEIAGLRIGSSTNREIAEAVFGGLHEVFSEKGISLAAQCCEHLNRAIVIENGSVPGSEPVNAVPHLSAGGAFATVAYETFRDPAVIEHIRADAGIDIGMTLIGMHLKEVAVPVRLTQKNLGEAIVICARTRPKFIGGCRAKYDDRLL